MNKSSRSLKWLFPFLVAPLMLSGCWDRIEINDLAFVLAAAIDKEDDLYRVSFLIPLPGNMGGTGGGGGGTGGVEPYTIQSEVGSTAWEAVDKIQSRLPRKIFIAHRRVVLFSEDLAKEGISLMLDSMARTPENRLSTYAAITKGKAADYLSAKVKMERFSAELMRELLQSDATVKVSVKDVISNLNTTGRDAFLPYLELNKAGTNGNKSDDIQTTGFSILNNGKEVTVLKNDNALALRLLLSKFKDYSQTLKMDDGKVSYHVRNVKTVMDPVIIGNQINFNISVVGDADIFEFLSKKNIFDEMPKFKEQIEAHTKADLTNVLEILKTKGSDVPSFGQILNRNYPKRWHGDWEARWDNLFSKVNFNVSIKVNIYDVGALSENMTKRVK